MHLIQNILIYNVTKEAINLEYKARPFSLKIYIDLEYFQKISHPDPKLNFNCILSIAYQVLKALNQEVIIIKLICV